jgi:hypothetical protein
LVLVTKLTAVLKATEGQDGLQALEQIQHHDRDEGDAEHALGVGGPALVGVGIDPDHLVQRAFHPPVLGAQVHPGHVVAERLVHRRQRGEQQRDLEQAGNSVVHQNFSGLISATNR